MGKLSKKALNFMKSLLKIDPKQRLTAEQALKHNYFEGMKFDENEGEQVVKLELQNIPSNNQRRAP